jgi:hypothetical protein
MSLIQTDSESTLQLQASWKEWTRVVCRFARHGVHTAEFSRQGYCRLHASLQEAIDRSLESMTGDVCVLRSMKELSAPWVSVDSLAAADRKLLQDLGERCIAVQKTWGGAAEAAPQGRKTALVAVLLVLAASVAGILLVVTRGSPDGFPLDARLPFAGLLRTLVRGGWILQSGIPIACAAVVVMVITWLVFRPPGRY